MIEQKLDLTLTQLEKLIVTTQEERDLLTTVDQATTAIGNNVQVIANNVTTASSVISIISDEMDQLIANSNVPTDIVSQLTSLRDKSQAAAAALDASTSALTAQVPALQAIATKGASNPVPVPPPPPPAPAQ
jgi:hypothetical protein